MSALLTKLERRLAQLRRVDDLYPCPGDALDHALLELAIAAEIEAPKDYAECPRIVEALSKIEELIK